MPSTQVLAFGVTTLLATGTSALYTGCDHYNASNFFNEFSFFNEADPTQGFVNYLSMDQANLSSLAAFTLEASPSIFLGGDYKTANPPNPGRNSVRLTSNKSYAQGLFIADIAHMPNWPNSGEIDILEGFNENMNNTVTLHSGEGCVMSGPGSLPTSILTNPNCNANNGFDGCPTSTSNNQGYGPGFNEIGGGVYAMEWNSSAITVWFFPRSAMPADIIAANEMTSPDPSKWGTPTASFSGPGCDIGSHFKNHSIVFDTTFCGQWAGQAEVWGSSPCAALAPACNQYVAANPAAFQDAYWLINKVMVYQDYEAAGTK
ncbi:hypothetical protein D0Z07_5570 [Hyphodiscus hymeniophilus]|uniref:GH16 domain-containing protein n=1 Tax=Hyphodiscus hymeniophilus TaxID=353542 RepID=A0A9P6VIC1_9HELO|nr:hypothetical protein D0Z07_5570 [Hyphodiscus hymeniophilus]